MCLTAPAGLAGPFERWSHSTRHMSLAAPSFAQSNAEQAAPDDWASGWARARDGEQGPPTPARAPSPAAPPLPPPAPAPAGRQGRSSAQARRDHLTLFEWGHDSPLPVKVTNARAALWPSIGVRKDWGGPQDGLQLSAKAALQLPHRLHLDLACKEAVLGGRLTVSLPACRLEYRKRFKLPNGALLAVGAGLERCGREAGGDGAAGGGGWLRFKPFFGCQLQVDSGHGSRDELVVSEKGFTDTHRVKLPTRWGSWEVPAMEVEVASTLSLPPGLSALAGMATSATTAGTAGLHTMAGSVAGSTAGLQGLVGSAADVQGTAGSAAQGLAGGMAELQSLAGSTAQGLAGSAPSLHSLASGTGRGLAGGAASLQGRLPGCLPPLSDLNSHLSSSLESSLTRGVSLPSRLPSIPTVLPTLSPAASSPSTLMPLRHASSGNLSVPPTPPGAPSLAVDACGRCRAA